jgi:hypothetical protein
LAIHWFILPDHIDSGPSPLQYLHELPQNQTAAVTAFRWFYQDKIKRENSMINITKFDFILNYESYLRHLFAQDDLR